MKCAVCCTVKVIHSHACERTIENNACIHIIGERAKRARRYLVMFMETRDIYIYLIVTIINGYSF